jgi:hypothetical protein
MEGELCVAFVFNCQWLLVGVYGASQLVSHPARVQQSPAAGATNAGPAVVLHVLEIPAAKSAFLPTYCLACYYAPFAMQV